MTDYEKLFCFENLYKAHIVARRSKRDKKEVIDFELNLASNLTELSNNIKNKTYTMAGYYSFVVHDPKDRVINALHYRDRVVQHCLCDEILEPILDKKLIYDNAACRKGKGTHFALKRLSGFMYDYYNKYGSDGYFLKCDIRKFFDNIDHEILKDKLRRIIVDEDVYVFLCQIIDSYEKSIGKGLPLGNQTSQWFAIYYLDGFDRLIKEKLKIKYYTRYMDDCVLIHHDKEYLKYCLKILNKFLKDLKLSFNEKTEIIPLKNGVNYLGWHFYLSKTGKIIRKLKKETKSKYKRKLKYLAKAYSYNIIEMKEVNEVLASYVAHLSFGHTYKLQKKVLNSLVLRKCCY